MISLRRRLIVLMLGVFALAWGVLTAIVFWDARREIHAFYDDRLEKIAEVLLDLSWHELNDEHADSVIHLAVRTAAIVVTYLVRDVFHHQPEHDV